MYNEGWARDILLTYRRLTPRAQQIDLCICQYIAEMGDADFFPEAISKVLLNSIRGGKAKGLWYQYKRLCQIYPLDKNRLDKVCKLLVKHLYPLLDDERQLLLNIC